MRIFLATYQFNVSKKKRITDESKLPIISLEGRGCFYAKTTSISRGGPIAYFGEDKFTVSTYVSRDSQLCCQLFTPYVIKRKTLAPPRH